MKKVKLFEFNKLIVSRVVRFVKVTGLSDPYLKRGVIGIFNKIDSYPYSKPKFNAIEEIVLEKMYRWETRFLYKEFGKIQIKKLVKSKRTKRTFRKYKFKDKKTIYVKKAA